jgi:hypothetical protein
MDHEVHRASGGRPKDTSSDPEMVEGRSIGGRPVVGDEAGYTAGSSDHSPYTKGNFQFERTVTGWRARYSVLDLRLKK